MSAVNKVTIVGAGITGLTIARRLADHGIESVVYERRPVLGGNSSSHWDSQVEVHDHGPHIFHTSSRQVWDFVRRFAEFNGFHLSVCANVCGKVYRLPFGLDLINALYGVTLTPGTAGAFLARERHAIADPSNLEEKALSLVGSRVYESFIAGYTEKQWGTHPRNLPPWVITRLPFRTTYSTDYFDDVYQGVPCDGYCGFFASMVASPLITVLLNRQFSVSDVRQGSTVFYTGCIDELLSYRHGALPWRSLSFEYERVGCSDSLGCPVMNFPDRSVPYTRKVDYSSFHPELHTLAGDTVVCTEYPQSWCVGREPYYPVNGSESADLYNRYAAELCGLGAHVIACGRLGAYRYMDMDDAVAAALQVADEFIRRKTYKEVNHVR